MTDRSDLDDITNYLRGTHVRCRSCGYDLCGLNSERCPECGWRIDLAYYQEPEARPPPHPDTDRRAFMEPLRVRDLWWLAACALVIGLMILARWA